MVTDLPDPARSVDAEQAVLGAAIRDPAALVWLAGHLRTDDFHRPAHRTIAEVLLELFRDQVPVQPSVVLAVLAERGQLEEVGGAAYLHDLDAAVTTSAEVEWVGQQVRKAARMRHCGHVLVQLGQLLREPGWDADRVAALAVGRFQDILEDTAGEDLAHDPTHLLKAVQEASFADRADATASWGLDALDGLTKGLHPGHLVLIAARTSVGKSSLLIQTAAHNAERMPVLFCTYEMTQAEIGQHLLARFARCTLDHAKARVDTPQLGAAVTGLQALDLVVFDHDPDIATLAAQVQALHAKRPLGLVCVDYLQKVPPSKRSRSTTRQEEVAEVSAKLKSLAKRLRVPVVAASQLNRRTEADGRLPELYDLRDSGAQEQDADQVLMLHREEGARRTTALLRKNRMGEKGSAVLDFLARSAVFADPLPGHDTP